VPNESGGCFHKDATGAEASFTYEFDRIKTVTDALSKTTEFFYDAVGNRGVVIKQK
jgi:hypothetical protein